MTAKDGQQAVANGRQVKSGMSGMCQAYVRDPCWRVPALYGSAQEAWNGSTQKHHGDRTPPVGAPCYFRGGNYGHAVISVGEGKVVRSTDCTSAGEISEVELSWFEAHWGYTYLGWTGDLNGIDLPLGSSSGGDSAQGVDDVGLQDPITEWSPDEGTSDEKTTVGKTLNQARGYSEDTYERMKELQQDVRQLQKQVQQILDKL